MQANITTGLYYLCPAYPNCFGQYKSRYAEKDIKNERRVEFAFENQRFWDVRRWMIAEQVDNGIMHGLNARPTPQQVIATGLMLTIYTVSLAVFYQ